jgi:hypothetical protein
LNINDSAGDLSEGFTFKYDFGDGTSQTTNSSTAVHTYAATGYYLAHGTITDEDGGSTTYATRVAVGVTGGSGNGGIITTRYFITGADSGGPQVNVYNLDGSVKFKFFAYAPTFTGGVRVAAGDVTGDGVDDIITGAGHSGGPHIQVFDGTTGAAVASFFAFNPNFTGGIYVASADINGDGFSDIIVGAGESGGPEIKVIDGTKLNQVGANGEILNSAVLFDFMAYAPTFTGGVRVAAGDVNGDGVPDLIVGAGPGGGPHVQVFDGKTGLAIRSFFATNPAFTGGIYVASGDVNADGFADIIVGMGASPNFESHIIVIDGANVNHVIYNFAPFPAFFGGVRVATEDLNGDGNADLIVTPGYGRYSNLLGLSGVDLSMLQNFSPYDPAFIGGIFVG